MVTETLRNEVLKLKALEKILLVEFIFESLNKSDETIQSKWIEESEKRYDAYKAGKVRAISYEEVMKRLDK